MKLLYTTLFTFLFVTGCQQDSSSKRQVSLMGQNPNSITFQSLDKQKDRENKIELSKIDAKTKIEIAKLQSQNQLLIAKVSAEANKDIAKSDSQTKITTTQIDSLTKKEDIQSSFYIKIALIALLLIAIILFFFNNKKNRELKAKMHQDELDHQRALKEKDIEQQRLDKLLQLVGEGKLSPQMQEDVILSLTKPKDVLIESK